ncbi:MAG: phosphoadenosine phosphosulfate reductase, partial [Mesorhizobium sp.]
MLAKPRPLDRIVDVEAGIAAEAAGLDALYGHLKPLEIIERSAQEFFHGEIAAVSSFGADSAVLLHMIAKIDRTLPVIFLDTGKHFEETLGYRDALAADFGLTDIRVITPEEAALERIDPTGNLNETDTDACCEVRKV